MPDLHIIKYISVAELTTKHFWTGTEKLIMFFIKKSLSIQSICIVVRDNKCD